MIRVKQNEITTFAISVDEKFTSWSDFENVTAILVKQNTDSASTIGCDVGSFNCKEKILKLTVNFSDSFSGEYKITIESSGETIYHGMIIVDKPDKTSGLNGVVIG